MRFRRALECARSANSCAWRGRKESRRTVNVKGPPAKAGGLVGSTAVVVPTGPALTRLRYRVPGQDSEVPTLVPSLRPTRGPCARGGFLNADRSKPRLQTSSGSCTKQGTRRAGRALALVTNLGEGRESGVSARLRHIQRSQGVWMPPRKGHRVGVGGHAPPHCRGVPAQHVPSASAVLSGF
jgi:hypothetical protein